MTVNGYNETGVHEIRPGVTFGVEISPAVDAPVDLIGIFIWLRLRRSRNE